MCIRDSYQPARGGAVPRAGQCFQPLGECAHGGGAGAAVGRRLRPQLGTTPVSVSYTHLDVYKRQCLYEALRQRGG